MCMCAFAIICEILAVRLQCRDTGEVGDLAAACCAGAALLLPARPGPGALLDLPGLLRERAPTHVFATPTQSPRDDRELGCPLGPIRDEPPSYCWV